MSILATSDGATMVPVPAVCGRPSSPVCAGISGQVLWCMLVLRYSSWFLHGSVLPRQELFRFRKHSWKYFQLHQGVDHELMWQLSSSLGSQL